MASLHSGGEALLRDRKEGFRRWRSRTAGSRRLRQRAFEETKRRATGPPPGSRSVDNPTEPTPSAGHRPLAVVQSPRRSSPTAGPCGPCDTVGAARGVRRSYCIYSVDDSTPSRRRRQPRSTSCYTSATFQTWDKRSARKSGTSVIRKWWRRRESNPGPKRLRTQPLHAQSDDLILGRERASTRFPGPSPTGLSGRRLDAPSRATRFDDIPGPPPRAGDGGTRAATGV